jgi:hypothetical protein
LLAALPSSMIQYNYLIGEGAVRAHQHVVCNCLPEDFDLKQSFPNPKYLMKYSNSVSPIGSGFNRVSGSGSRRAKMTHKNRRK